MDKVPSLEEMWERARAEEAMTPEQRLEAIKARLAKEQAERAARKNEGSQ